MPIGAQASLAAKAIGVSFLPCMSFMSAVISSIDVGTAQPFFSKTDLR